MACMCDGYEPKYEQILENILCDTCRLLTKDQMLYVKNCVRGDTLLDWYESHVRCEYLEYKKRLAHPYMFEKNWHETEIKLKNLIEICMAESKRLGFKLEAEDEE